VEFPFHTKAHKLILFQLKIIISHFSMRNSLRGVANEKEGKRISTNGLFICYIFQSCFPDAYIYMRNKNSC